MKHDYYQIYEIARDGSLVSVDWPVHCSGIDDVHGLVQKHGDQMAEYTALPVYICKKYSKSLNESKEY